MPSICGCPRGGSVLDETEDCANSTGRLTVLFKLRRLLSYSNVMATLAVFIALGGSSYAALRVTSRNVPKDALTGADIKKLTGKDVTNNSLTGADVKEADERRCCQRKAAR